MKSSKLKKALGIMFFLTFFSSTIQEKTLTPPNIIKYSLNALEIEQLKTINLLEEDFKDFNFLKKLEEDSTFIENKNLATDKETKNLKLMIKKYEKSKFSRGEYKKDGVYDKFVQENKKISREKEKVGDYEIISYNKLLHLKKRDSYKQENSLERILKDKEKLSKLKNSFSNSENKSKKRIGSTIFNVSEYFPFIYEISKKENFEMSSLLSIISNESSGYPYIVGVTGDINLFQINPSTIPLIYSKMRSSQDSLFREYIKDKNLKEFEERVKMDPKTNIVSGIYLLKLLREKSKNESKRILLYHLGQAKYNKLPFSIRKKISRGKINFSKDISKHDERFRGLSYLKNYYEKKEAFDKIKKSLN